MSQPRRRENCHYCGSDEHVVLECAEYASDAQTVQWELREKPLHAGLLAPNELDSSYWPISKVLFRHAFNDHDCQGPDCPAMMLHNSSEMTHLLADAYKRGRADLRVLVEAWAAKNEIGAPPLDWATLGDVLRPETTRAIDGAGNGLAPSQLAEPPHQLIVSGAYARCSCGVEFYFPDHAQQYGDHRAAGNAAGESFDVRWPKITWAAAAVSGVAGNPETKDSNDA
jgi:hypothetical protein